jgi:hypothetical protein
MTSIKTVAPAVLLVALSLAASPAMAQGRGRDDRNRGGRDSGRQTQAASPRQSAPPASRSVAPRDNGQRSVAPAQSAPSRQAYRPQQVAPRGNDQRAVAPRQYAAPSRQTYAPQAGQRYGQTYAPQAGQRYDRGRQGVAVPRSNYGGNYYAAPRDAYRGNYGGYRSIAPYRPRFFGRPYYSFRPRLNIGFGLWLGFGVPYPYSWVAGYPPPVYGYYDGAFGIVPNAPAYGGVSFYVTPADAAVIVDGEYIGIAGDFGPDAQPLTLTPGTHRIELQADGYRPMVYDLNVVPGQVIPFQGQMQPY